MGSNQQITYYYYLIKVQAQQDLACTPRLNTALHILGMLFLEGLNAILILFSSGTLLPALRVRWKTGGVLVSRRRMQLRFHPRGRHGDDDPHIRTP